MDQVRHQFWRIPDRLSPSHARWLIGLSVALLGIALLGFSLYDGWHRVAYVSAFVLIGLGNFLYAMGSVLPESPGATAVRGLVRPISLLMFVALAVSLAFQLGIWT